MWKLDENREMLLKRLCNSYGPTSYEIAAQKIVSQEFERMKLGCKGDAIGNLYATILPEADFHIGIVAHIDEVGLQITEITESGLLRFRRLGGVRATSLIGHKVIILTHEGPVTGIVGCDPLQDNGTDTGILIKTSDLWIDAGFENKKQCSQIVSIGDYTLFKEEYEHIGVNRIASKALDNRLGVFVMIEAIRELKDSDIQIGVVGISSVQEEISLRGIAASSQKLDVAIILDVDFATDIPTGHTQMGCLSLGKGIGMNKNADNNIVIQQCMQQIARLYDIPVQTTLSRNISGGTDAAQLQLKGNIATLNINIPLRYMHTHAEICDYRDVEYAVRAVVELVKHLNRTNIRSFVPWKME